MDNVSIIKITYKVDDYESVKKAFNQLMPIHSGNVALVLSDLKNNPIAVDNQELWTSELSETIEIVKEWSVGEVVAIGNIRKHLGVKYSCIQAHTTQSDWTPPVVPALWKAMIEAPIGQEYPDWVQPTGAQDAYKIGDKVRFNNENWESLINGNVWSPTAYPQGWKKI